MCHTARSFPREVGACLPLCACAPSSQRRPPTQPTLPAAGHLVAALSSRRPGGCYDDVCAHAVWSAPYVCICIYVCAHTTHTPQKTHPPLRRGKRSGSVELVGRARILLDVKHTVPAQNSRRHRPVILLAAGRQQQALTHTRAFRTRTHTVLIHCIAHTAPSRGQEAPSSVAPHPPSEAGLPCAAGQAPPARHTSSEP